MTITNRSLTNILVNNIQLKPSEGITFKDLSSYIISIISPKGICYVTFSNKVLDIKCYDDIKVTKNSFNHLSVY